MVFEFRFFPCCYPYICLEVNTLHALALDYAIACYPLLVIAVSYMLIELHAHNFEFPVYFWRLFRWVFIYFQK